MAINVSDLPPKYQAQAMKKYMEQQKQRRGPAPPAAPPQDPAKGTKYHNTPTERVTASGAVLNVMDLIDVLPANSTERTVVEMRHIDCRGWDKIAEALYMSRSNVFNYYNAALDKILENKRNRKLLEEYMARKQQRAGPHGRNNRP